MDARTFARIKNLIWDQLLATKAEAHEAKFGFFFFVLSVTNPKPPQMMSSSANDRPFLSSFRHIPPQESFVQLAYLTIQTKNGRRGERLIWSNLG